MASSTYGPGTEPGLAYSLTTCQQVFGRAGSKPARFVAWVLTQADSAVRNRRRFIVSLRARVPHFHDQHLQSEWCATLRSQFGVAGVHIVEFVHEDDKAPICRGRFPVGRPQRSPQKSECSVLAPPRGTNRNWSCRE